MKKNSINKKTLLIFTILSIVLFIFSIYTPFIQGYQELKTARWRKIDFLFIIKPYLMGLFASIMMLLAAMLNKKRFVRTFIYFFIVNLPMVIFLNLVLSNELYLDLYRLSQKKDLHIYLLYLVHMVGLVLMLVQTFTTLADYEVKLKSTDD